jgi:diguanylate cyclase (GGDEF)-like protein
MMWGLLFPIIAMNLCGTKNGLIITIVFNLIIYIFGYYYISIETIHNLIYIRYIAISIIISLLVYFYEKSFSQSFEVQNKLNKILKKNAITDSLTRLFNRRHFDDIMNKEFNRAKRAKKSFVLAIIDVDNFKAYNDTYGHGEGDDILIKLGEILNQQTSRSGDYAFRIGGEEFAIILQSESYEDVYTHFEHLRLLIESEEITHISNKPYNHLTISIGVTLAQDSNDTTIKEIYSTADKNLYYIKRNGRNGTKLTTL